MREVKRKRAMTFDYKSVRGECHKGKVIKVDHKDYFLRPGFLRITIFAFLGYKASNFV